MEPEEWMYKYTEKHDSNTVQWLSDEKPQIIGFDEHGNMRIKTSKGKTYLISESDEAGWYITEDIHGTKS